MKKFASILLVLCMVLGMTMTASAAVSASDIKVGMICIGDENEGYSANHINGLLRGMEALGIAKEQVTFKYNIPETEAAYEAAIDLAEQGCNIIFANSFGHESYIALAAEEYPEIEFCHATGTTAMNAGLENFHNYFAAIYEARYVSGVVAGLKLNEMIESGKITAEQAKIGYVGAFTYAEVISGYTSFYLGAKYICPSVTMDVQFTGSWYDENEEKNAAIALMNNGCVLISQHADSMGAPTACEERSVPNVSYNGSTVASCPNTFIVSSKIDWTPYFVYICNSYMNGEEIAVDWTGTISTGSVALAEVNTQAAAEGTQAKIDEIKAKLVDGSLKVFDTSTFTVTVVTEGENTKNVNAKVDANGNLTSYMADVDTDAAYTADTEVIKDGYFHESEFRSAPCFDIQIDGITLLNAKF